MIGGFAVIGVGSLIAFSGGRELARWFRARHRMVRTIGLVVDVVDVGSGGTVSRSPVFHFTTLDGRPVQTMSSASTWPGPRIGKRLTVIYDPKDPEGSGERIGAWKVKMALSPLLVAGGLAFVVFGVTLLL